MEILEKLPAYTYLTIKYHLAKIQALSDKPLLVVATAVLATLLAVPICTLGLLLTLGYRKLIDIILSQKFKHRYRGLLRGVDAICCNQNACTPAIFFLIDYGKSHDELCEDFVNMLRQCRHARHEKLFFSWNSFMGYHYYYKNMLAVDDYVTLAEHEGHVDAIKNKRDFAAVIAQYDVAALPDAGRALFHIIVYPQRVELPNVQGAKLACFKMHHALADGKALFGWLMADLADKEAPGPANGALPNGCRGTNGVDKCNLQPDEYFRRVKKTLFEDKLKAMPSDCRDDNILLGRNLVDEKFICWFSDFSSAYIDKIKAIRKCKRDVSFLDVINTCISSSLTAYYEKHASDVPLDVSGGVVLLPANCNFRYGDTADFALSNEFSVGMLRFPIARVQRSDKPGQEILARLSICQKEYQAVKESVDVKYFYWLSDMFSVLPYQIPRFLAHNLLKVTIGVSSFPGLDRSISLFGGNMVKDIILMAPNSPGTALHFVNCSYGNRFKISLTIDKSVVVDTLETLASALRRNNNIIDLYYLKFSTAAPNYTMYNSAVLKTDASSQKDRDDSCVYYALLPSTSMCVNHSLSLPDIPLPSKSNAYTDQMQTRRYCWHRQRLAKAEDVEILPFFPHYQTHWYEGGNLLVAWFEMKFSQARYNFNPTKVRSNACTLIALLLAAYCSSERVQTLYPQNSISYSIIKALAIAMLNGNAIYDDMKQRGALASANLSIPEAINCAGRFAQRIREWKSVLYMQSLADTLYTNVRIHLEEWRSSSHVKKHNYLYIILISDHRSVLIIDNWGEGSCTLVDSHQHSIDKGAAIAVVNRENLQLLCAWFAHILYKYNRSNPNLYELSFMYYRRKR